MTKEVDFIAQEDELVEVPLTVETVEIEDEEVVPLMDIRQKLLWDGYIDRKSPTFGNAYRSAIAAGYTPATATNITQTTFFRGKLRRLNMLGRAEKVLKRTLVMKTTDEAGKEQADLLRIQVDAAKHITKTLGKDEGYSERQELTGKDGSQIVFLPTELMGKYEIESGTAPKEAIITNQE